MEQFKRLHSNIAHDYDNIKRKKLNITTDETNGLTKEFVTTFEDFSNELIYEVFEYLDFHHAFYAFYDLNKRFENLFVYSNLPIKINISSLSKSTFHSYMKNIIIPHIHRIKSFRLSNPFATEMMILISPIMANLSRLETLIIDNIESYYIEGIVNSLFSLPVLSSLTIRSIDHIKNQNDIYQKIFHLPVLKYCQVSLETLRNRHPLAVAMNKFSPIEHLIINNKVSLGQINSLLSYVPQLRRISFGNLDERKNSQLHMGSIALKYLTHVSLKLHSVAFNDFELLVRDICHQVQVLHIAVYDDYHRAIEYLTANRWERLISTHMPNLCIFDFHYDCYISDDSNDRQRYEASVLKFNSLFWIKRQWFFQHQFYRRRRYHRAIFYSTNPYRTRHYELYEQSNEKIFSNSPKTNIDIVRYLQIHSTRAIMTCGDYFPNATELTLVDTFDVPPRDSIARSLDHIIPLRQLSKLILNCHHFSFEQIIGLLYFTPNVYTLELDSIVLYQTDPLSIQRNENFRLVSNTNMITNVIIDKESTLEKIQLCVALFPRLEYLTINLNKKDLESITRFLLSKPNNNTRYLSSLCISKQRKDFIEPVRSLIESEKLLNDYTIKLINRKVYLWW